MDTKSWIVPTHPPGTFGMIKLGHLIKDFGIVFQGFKDGVVFLHMRGACSGCPSSTATLRHGIENLLKHFCPDVQEVRPV